MPVIKPTRGSLLNKSHTLARGLVGCWLLNEGSGSKVFDLSGDGINGTFDAGNPPTWTPGKTGSALNFVGASDQFVDLGGNLSLLKPQTMSIVVLVKAGVVADLTGIFDTTDAGGSNGYILATNSSKFYFYIRDSGWSIAQSGAVSTGIWYYVVGTYDGTTVKIYVNGVLGPTTDTASQVDYATNHHYVGKYTSSGSSFDGIIDHVIFYNRDLSASEIALLFRRAFCMLRQRRRLNFWSAPSVAVVAARRSHVGFRPIEGAERLRGLRRNALY